MSATQIDPAGIQGLNYERKATCRMCHGGCSTIVTVEDGRVVKVVGDPDSPINEGRLCTKAGKASIEQLYHPDRIEHPRIRVGPKGSGQWREVSWDDAIAYVASKMAAIRDEHGAEAMAFARGVSMNNNQIVTRLANVFGSPNILSINYYCYGPRASACALTASGEYAGRQWDTVAAPDLFGEPNCIVEWGSQKRISNDHGMIGHAPMTRALSRKPVSIIVDPRKSPSSGPGDIWLPLRTGTDAAMALGWIHVIIEEELYDKEFVENWCHGFEELKERVKEYTPERVAEITWCDAESIRKAARLYATTKPATIAWGNGMDQMGLNTLQSTRAITILIGITGNLDVRGGNVFWPMPRLADTEKWDHLSAEQAAKRLGADRFKALNMRPTVYAHPPTVFRTILSDKPYPVKGMLVVGNNPAVCYPNTKTVTDALRKLDLLVVCEIFMSPTAELADVVLPAASNLERDEPRLYMHIKRPEGMVMDASTKEFAKLGERLSDWEILMRIGRALGHEKEFSSVEDFADEALAPLGVTAKQFREMDPMLEPMRFKKYTENGFGTATRKFEIWSTVLEGWGYDPLPSHVEPAESPVSTPEVFKDYPLILSTGARLPMYWNSNGHPLPSLRRQQPEPMLEIHPDTAANLAIPNSTYAIVETRRGAMRMKVRHNAKLHPSAIAVPSGWWRPELPGPDHAIFEVCSNVLTDDDPDNCDPILGSSPLKTMLCRVRPCIPSDPVSHLPVIPQ